MSALPVSTFTQPTARPRDQKDLILQLNKRLAKHQGEFVLMVENEEVSRVKDAPPGPHDWHIVTSLYLGIINGDALVKLNSFEHAIPTDKYTLCRLSYGHPRVFTYQGNLHAAMKFLLYHLDLPVRTDRSFVAQMAEAKGKPLAKLELRIGDEEVSSWAGDDEHKLLVLRAMARPLGRPLPQAVQPKLKEAIAEQRQVNLRRIAYLFDQHFALLREIRVQGKPKDVKVPSLSVFTDKEVLIDAETAVFSGPPGRMNEKLEELKHEIRLALTEARQFGLRRKDIIEALSQQYRQMLTVHLDHISPSGRKKKTT